MHFDIKPQRKQNYKIIEYFIKPSNTTNIKSSCNFHYCLSKNEFTIYKENKELKLYSNLNYKL